MNTDLCVLRRPSEFVTCLAPVVLEVDVRVLPSVSAASHGAIPGDDPDAVTTLSPPGRVVPKTLGDPQLGGGCWQAVLLPVLENDRAELATAVPGRGCMSF